MTQVPQNSRRPTLIVQPIVEYEHTQTALSLFGASLETIRCLYFFITTTALYRTPKDVYI